MLCALGSLVSDQGEAKFFVGNGTVDIALTAMSCGGGQRRQIGQNHPMGWGQWLTTLRHSLATEKVAIKLEAIH
jgi:hypothetical protein